MCRSRPLSHRRFPPPWPTLQHNEQYRQEQAGLQEHRSGHASVCIRCCPGQAWARPAVAIVPVQCVFWEGSLILGVRVLRGHSWPRCRQTGQPAATHERHGPGAGVPPQSYRRCGLSRCWANDAEATLPRAVGGPANRATADCVLSRATQPPGPQKGSRSPQPAQTTGHLIAILPAPIPAPASPHLANPPKDTPSPPPFSKMADAEELIDYDEEDETTQQEVHAASVDDSVAQKETKKGSYVGIHATGFRDFLLKPELLRATADCGFEHPSEVQQECIPQAIFGMDVLCQAKSGMGKTAVFVLATMQQLEPGSGAEGPSVIVLCHTRELAYQIQAEYARFSKYLPDVKTVVLYGGISVKQNIESLRNDKPQIVVGTPGRVAQLIRDKELKLGNVKHFVLDECDKMLEALDMRRDVQDIFRSTPHHKQVMMFSATLSKEIRPICKKFMQTPLEIFIDDETKLTLHGLQQHYVELEERQKNRKLSDLLDNLEFNQVVIFVKSVQRAIELDKLLRECSFPSICIHSQMKQDERINRYKQFKDFSKRIMVATDIFGRGIDIERVNIVINYDMPDNADSYLHRVGRAGRFGTKGLAITFATKGNDEDLKILNQVQDRFEVNITQLPDTIDPSVYRAS